MTGKEKCEILKQLRRSIAEANGIVYLSAECSHTGDCNGHCEKCEAEAKYLDVELNRLAQEGKELKITNIVYPFPTNSPSLPSEKSNTEPLTSKVVSMLIEELDLSVRSYIRLKRAGINTVEDLINMTYADVTKIKDLGQRGVDEITQILHSLGLKLKEEPPREVFGIRELAMQITVDELNMSTKTTLLLKKAGINTVEDMVNYADWDYLLLKKGESGVENFCEIEAKLNSMGLKLKENPLEKLTIDYVEET